VNLSAYHSAASATDVIDLMAVLGYESWNLYGISYGTRVALTLLRDHPDGIRSVVLDSAVPIQVNLTEQFAPNIQRALDLLFERCAADKGCEDKYPDLENSYYALVDQLNREPLSIAYAEETFQVSGDLLASLTIRALHDADAIVQLPKQISELTEGNTYWLPQQIGDLLYYWEISEGMRHSSICSEEIPFNSAEVTAGSSGSIHPALVEAVQSYDFDVCELWQVVPAGEIETQAVSSDVPTLILSGDYDPVTPPVFGNMVAESLTNSYHFVFPGLSHGVVRSRRCGMEIMEAFLDAPDLIPDSSCIDTLKVGFLTR
jgi:pimeloyl-ACP methyl ester carboxylesterase